MANVYVEPLPKGSTGQIVGYALEYEHGLSVIGKNYALQQQAVDDAKRLGHRPAHRASPAHEQGESRPLA